MHPSVKRIRSAVAKVLFNNADRIVNKSDSIGDLKVKIKEAICEAVGGDSKYFDIELVTINKTLSIEPLNLYTLVRIYGAEVEFANIEPLDSFTIGKNPSFAKGMFTFKEGEPVYIYDENVAEVDGKKITEENKMEDARLVLAPAINVDLLEGEPVARVVKPNHVTRKSIPKKKSGKKRKNK